MTETPHSLDIASLIQTAKLGRTRKDAQIDCCAVFAAALYDVLTAHGISCQMVCAVNKGGPAWAHSVVEVDGRLYDSMGEFSAEIYRKRAKIHPTVPVTIAYSPDFREDCFESDFVEMHAFYLKMLTKALTPPTNRFPRKTTTVAHPEAACA